MASVIRVDFSEVLSSLVSYPYNIITGAAVVGSVVIVLRSYFRGGVCRSRAKLNGKTVIITGGNTGIGKETAIDLAKRKARVILACRSDERGRQAVAEVRKISHNQNVEYRHLDLASLGSVKQFAEGILEEEIPVDILINNAAVMRCPYWKTEDGFEMQFGVNHLGHFLLTNLLLERIKEAPNARIINVSSKAYRRAKKGINFDDLNSENGYEPLQAYSQSKLANILFTKVLAERLNDTSVTVNCLHPGVIWTELGRHLEKTIGLVKKILCIPIVLLCLKTPWQGAQTTIFCAVSEDLVGVSGRYFADCKEMPLVTAIAKDRNVAEKLWDVSERMVGLK